MKPETLEQRENRRFAERIHHDLVAAGAWRKGCKVSVTVTTGHTWVRLQDGHSALSVDYGRIGAGPLHLAAHISTQQKRRRQHVEAFVRWMRERGRVEA
jgi:hypothetical protein